jgi:hypothetical protein
MWLMVSSYRLSCLLFSSIWAWWTQEKVTAGACGAIFFVILGYLDYNWTLFFFHELGCYKLAGNDSNSISTSGSRSRKCGTIGVWDYMSVSVIVAYGMGVMFGWITVFCL